MIKLIASDLDGTLLRNGAQEINPEIFDLILRLKEKDIHFAAASGRQLYSAAFSPRSKMKFPTSQKTALFVYARER